jgi:hypothetical protein
MAARGSGAGHKGFFSVFKKEQKILLFLKKKKQKDF